MTPSSERVEYGVLRMTERRMLCPGVNDQNNTSCQIDSEVDAL
ncbi:MAG: hypothetical protein OEZ23_05300 [Gammaproteobacteria bacterium]|nr:hypothetical protein [Gammaproteobacteria bacterium]